MEQLQVCQAGRKYLKNRIAGAAVPAAGVPAAGAFLSNTSLAIFAFLIANAGSAAAGVSGWSHVPVFAFPLVKIVTRGQQLQVCQAGRRYLFSLFTHKNRNAWAAPAGVSERWT